MHTFSLNGEWRLTHQKLNNRDYRKRPKKNSISASVPGDVHLDLINNGIIGDPLLGDNVTKCGWIGQCEWWYEKSFTYDEPHAGRHELVFEGLCCVADVWLNDVYLSSHRNMHRPLVIDVTKILKPKKKNRLVLRLLPFDDQSLRAPIIQRLNDLRWTEAIHNKDYCIKRGASHKALYSYGWDWTQGLPICGIWRDTYILTTSSIKIEDVFVRPETNGKIPISFVCNTVLDNVHPAVLTITINEKKSKKQVFEKKTNIQLGPGRIKYEVQAAVSDPKLWWPIGLGEQFLYEVTISIELTGHSTSESKIVFGIRSVEIEENPINQNQATFNFVINGVNVFAKGTNWIPPDIIPPRADDNRYLKLIDQYCESGFNYIRFWGGGIYEKDLFYNLCDERGILILHDMMFSCLEVPDFDNEYVKEACLEVEYNVKRLRNHASIIVWCGSNEADAMGYEYSGCRPEGKYYGHHLLHDVFPSIFLQIDPTRPYIPSDPYIGKYNKSGNPSDPFHGTYHGNFGINAYTTDSEIDVCGVPSFLDEYYAASPSPKNSLLKYLDSTQMDWNNPVFKMHEIASVQMLGGEQSVFATNLYHHSSLRFKDILSEEVSNTFTENHCQVIKRFTEALRLRRNQCGGLAFWMFNSAYTMNDWSLSDYYCLPKPAFYEAKRSNTQILPAIKIYKTKLEFYIINDTRRSVSGRLTCEVREFDGTCVWRKSLQIKATGNATTIHLNIPRNALPAFDPDKCYISSTFIPNSGSKISNHRLFGKPKELLLPNSRVQIKSVKGHPGYFEINSDKFSRNIQIEPHTTENRADDNFFNLLPGEHKIVRFSKPVRLKDVSLKWDNSPERDIRVVKIETTNSTLECISPYKWVCTVYNPTDSPKRYEIKITVPRGLHVSHDSYLEVDANQKKETSFSITIDPFIIRSGNIPIDIRIGNYTVYESIVIHKPFQINQSGWLEIHNPHGFKLQSEQLFLKCQHLSNSKVIALPLRHSNVTRSGTTQLKLDLTPDVIPYTCEIWNKDRKIHDFYAPTALGKRFWHELEKNLLHGNQLCFQKTRNTYWPDLINEGGGYSINRYFKEKWVEWKCNNRAKVLLFLHHDTNNIYINLFTRKIPFSQPYSGLDVWKASCIEIALGLEDGDKYIDFSLALTPLGPQEFHRRGEHFGLVHNPKLKIYHQSESETTSYHYALAKERLPGLDKSEKIRFSACICQNKLASQYINLFGGIQLGVGMSRSGIISLD